MNFQKLIVVGNITRDAQRKTSEKGDVTYTTFRVGVRDGKERSVYFPVTVFGKQGETLGAYLTKGRQVLVEGRITTRESGHYSVVADRVVLGFSQDKNSVPASEPVAEETDE